MESGPSKRRRGDGEDASVAVANVEAALRVAPAPAAGAYSVEDGVDGVLSIRSPVRHGAALPHTPSTIEFAGVFENDWVLGDVLGRGTFSVVYRCTRRDTGEVRAVKVIDTRRFRLSSAFRATSVLDEVCILRSLDHPHIMKVGEVYDGLINGHEAIFITSELAAGGELFDSIIKAGNFSEAQARHVAWQVLDALAYMHGRGVIHRDLKPENLLVFSTTFVPADDPVVRRHLHAAQHAAGGSEQATGATSSGSSGASATHRVPMLNLKLADFGVARYVGSAAIASGATTFVGSPQYVAPEVLFARDVALSKKAHDDGEQQQQQHVVSSYGSAVDVYSLGVILYVCLAGYLPFDDAAPKPQDVLQAEAAAQRAAAARGMSIKPDSWEDRVRAGRFYFAPPVWTHISEGAKDLIRRMMTVDPSARITVAEAQAHAWFSPVREALTTDEALAVGWRRGGGAQQQQQQLLHVDPGLVSAGGSPVASSPQHLQLVHQPQQYQAQVQAAALLQLPDMSALAIRDLHPSAPSAASASVAARLAAQQQQEALLLAYQASATQQQQVLLAQYQQQQRALLQQQAALLQQFQPGGHLSPASAASGGAAPPSQLPLQISAGGGGNANSSALIIPTPLPDSLAFIRSMGGMQPMHLSAHAASSPTAAAAEAASATASRGGASMSGGGGAPTASASASSSAAGTAFGLGLGGSTSTSFGMGGGADSPQMTPLPDWQMHVLATVAKSMDFTSLLLMQRSIALTFEAAYLAVRDIPKAALVVRAHSVEARALQDRVRKTVLRCRAIAHSIIAILPDLKDSVLEGDAGLTQGIFSRMREWVGELKGEAAGMQSAYSRLVAEVQVSVEQARSLSLDMHNHAPSPGGSSSTSSSSSASSSPAAGGSPRAAAPASSPSGDDASAAAAMRRIVGDGSGRNGGSAGRIANGAAVALDVDMAMADPVATATAGASSTTTPASASHTADGPPSTQRQHHHHHHHHHHQQPAASSSSSSSVDSSASAGGTPPSSAPGSPAASLTPGQAPAALSGLSSLGSPSQQHHRHHRHHHHHRHVEPSPASSADSPSSVGSAAAAVIAAAAAARAIIGGAPPPETSAGSSHSSSVASPAGVSKSGRAVLHGADGCSSDSFNTGTTPPLSSALAGDDLLELFLDTPAVVGDERRLKRMLSGIGVSQQQVLALSATGEAQTLAHMSSGSGSGSSRSIGGGAIGRGSAGPSQSSAASASIRIPIPFAERLPSDEAQHSAQSANSGSQSARGEGGFPPTSTSAVAPRGAAAAGVDTGAEDEVLTTSFDEKPSSSSSAAAAALLASIDEHQQQQYSSMHEDRTALAVRTSQSPIAHLRSSISVALGTPLPPISTGAAAAAAASSSTGRLSYSSGQHQQQHHHHHQAQHSPGTSSTTSSALATAQTSPYGDAAATAGGGGSGGSPGNSDRKCLGCALADLRQVDVILTKAVEFWSGMELVIDVVVRRKEHSETLLRHSTSARMVQKATSSLADYSAFWQAFAYLCGLYVEKMQTDAPAMFAFLNASDDELDGVDEGGLRMIAAAAASGLRGGGGGLGAANNLLAAMAPSSR